MLINRVRQHTGEVQANPHLLGYQVRADEEGKTAEQLFQESLRKVSPSRECEHTQPSDHVQSLSGARLSCLIHAIHSGLIGLQNCVQHWTRR